MTDCHTNCKIELDKALKDYDECFNELNSYFEENSSLKGQVQSSEARIQQLERQLKKESSATRKLRESNRRKDSDISKLNEKIQKNIHSQSSLGKQQQEFSLLHEKVKQLTEKLQQHYQESSNVQQEIMKLRLDLIEKLRVINTLKTDLANKETANECLKRNLSDKDKELEITKKKLESLQEKNSKKSNPSSGSKRRYSTPNVPPQATSKRAKPTPAFTMFCTTRQKSDDMLKLMRENQRLFEFKLSGAISLIKKIKRDPRYLKDEVGFKTDDIKEDNAATVSVLFRRLLLYYHPDKQVSTLGEEWLYFSENMTKILNQIRASGYVPSSGWGLFPI
jgi:DNA repair exonuclease SbcCD ATPase subunit